MPTYYARKAGNINAADVWSTTPSGTASNLFPTFTSDDVLMANSFGITVNVDTAVGEVRNDTFSGATGGGNFTLSNGVTLTSNVISGNVNVQTIAFSAATGAIVGNIQAGNPGGNWHSVNNSGSGTLTITGNIVAGGSAASHGAGNTSTGTITIVGNVTGGSAASSMGVRNNNTGIVNITGIVTGGSNATAFGCDNSSTGQINITGTSVGGLHGAGASNSSTATVNITRVKGNAYGPGNSSGLAAVVGAANTGLGVIQIEELEYGKFGQSPTSGTGIRLKKLSSNVAVFNYVDSGSAKTLIDATTNAAMPAATDVRNGVSYASGALTGSCAVPAAGSVALGVPVDNTTGTAVLTPAAVWGHASRTITGGLVDTATTLTNAPASVTPSDIWSHASRTLTSASGPTAVQIRQEIDSNSTQLSAIKAKTDAVNVDRINNTATLSQVGNLLAQANS